MMVRVKFAKYGPLRFTGHLDVLRFFQKAIRRAGLDVVYTHGFNPHSGHELCCTTGMSDCAAWAEYMDVETIRLMAQRILRSACRRHVLTESIS